MITSQLKENIIQGWLLYVIRSFLQVGFRFQYQLINLVWLSFDFFSFSWSFTIRISVVLYFCVQLSKNYSHFYYSFCNQPVLFAQLENVSKLWNNKSTVYVSERNQNKCRVTLCNGIIKGWLYCLTSESKERFFVNNILFGSAWCLVIVQIQFSLIKEKIGRPEHFSNPPAPFKEDVICITSSVWNATDSFARRKWRKRNPCVARCVMNFINVQHN